MNLTPKEAVGVTFWTGFGLCAILAAFLQDLMGLDAYLAFVEEGWVHIPWGVWPPIIIGTLGFQYCVFRKMP